MAHPEAGALWNWLTSVSYHKQDVAGISVAPDAANPPIVQAFHGGHWARLLLHEGAKHTVLYCTYFRAPLVASRALLTAHKVKSTPRYH